MGLEEPFFLSLENLRIYLISKLGLRSCFLIFKSKWYKNFEERKLIWKGESNNFGKLRFFLVELWIKIVDSKSKSFLDK